MRSHRAIYGNTADADIYGTGSYPEPPQGWHRDILLMVSHPPFNAPYFLMASIPYWLQVGTKRQLGGVWGDMAYW